MKKERLLPSGHSEELFLIAGPCSAESEEQVQLIADQLAETKQVDLLRFGIWKPRTRPNSFEGRGEQALPWIVRAGKKVGIPVAVEVAKPVHVEFALAAGVDVLWIGARTTVNPFLIQEIAEALRGSEVPILVKNPINPDLNLWLGAIERLEQAGVSEVAAIHRGFSVYEPNKFRYPPCWEIPVEFMRLRPDISLICDPSHICGNRDWIGQVAQKALDLQMVGLMIEVHPNPEEALSDKSQQIRPQRLEELLNELVLRSYRFSDAVADSQLETFRSQIDNIDQELISLLAQRQSLIRDIGQLKLSHSVRIFQPNRWDELRTRALQQAQHLGLDPDFVGDFFQRLHQFSIDEQEQLLNPAEPLNREAETK